jgi:transposase
MQNDLNLPNNVEQLKVLIAQLNQQLQEKNQKINSLHYQLKSALQFRFGKKTEKLAAQLGLFDEAVLSEDEKDLATRADETITVASFTRQKGGRKPLPADLPREQIIHDLPEAEKICACGHVLHKMGEDKSEQLEFVPAQVKVLEHIRYKYGCRHCETGIKAAPLPAQPIPKSIATPGLLAHILVSKYHDHIPLYRQEHILQRYQIDIARSTLCHWVLSCGELFQPFINLIRQNIIQVHYVCVDETPVQVLIDANKINKSKSYMWIYLTGLPTHRLILYDYQPTRSSTAVNAMLHDFKGYLQTDGYAGYHELQAKEYIIAVGCWAHVRRKFMDIVKIYKTEGKAWVAVKIIKQLYAIEKQARESQLSFDKIKALRQEKAKPIIDEFRIWLEKTLLDTPPQNPLAKAVQYALNQWQTLLTYLDNGELMIDNNAVENAIRPFALGRRNWLFMGNERGATAAAAIYSLIMTAKANQLEPYRYLRYLLEQLPLCKTDEQRELLFPQYCKAALLAELK